MAGILLNRSRQAPAEDTPAFGGIAERFRRAGDLDRAIALCRDGLKKFPDQLSARVTLGWCLLDKGQYEDARAELERVLRRAPDNLAAIRGLAELHDRTEGAMPSMEEREGWRSEEAAAEAAHEADTRASAPVVHAVEDPFGPIAVTLASTTAAPPPEILHTAEDAERLAHAAATASSSDAAVVTAEPVELEDPATAAMAASSHASPAMLEDDADIEAMATLEAFEAGSDAERDQGQTSHVDLVSRDVGFVDADELTRAGEEETAALLASLSVNPAEPGSTENDWVSDLATDEPAAAVDLLVAGDAEAADADDLVAALHSLDSDSQLEDASLVLDTEPALDAGLPEELPTFDLAASTAMAEGEEATVEPTLQVVDAAEDLTSDGPMAVDVVHVDAAEPDAQGADTLVADAAQAWRPGAIDGIDPIDAIDAIDAVDAIDATDEIDATGDATDAIAASGMTPLQPAFTPDLGFVPDLSFALEPAPAPNPVVLRLERLLRQVEHRRLQLTAESMA
jgi:hypothetical protein